MTTVAEANAERWFKKVRGEGFAEGFAEGQEEVLHQMTADRFGDDTAAILVERFRSSDDPNRMKKVSAWLHECKTGDSLLARARREWPSQNGVRRGRGPSRTKGSRSKNSKNRS